MTEPINIPVTEQPSMAYCAGCKAYTLGGKLCLYCGKNLYNKTNEQQEPQAHTPNENEPPIEATQSAAPYVTATTRVTQ